MIDGLVLLGERNCGGPVAKGKGARTSNGLPEEKSRVRSMKH